MSALINYWIKTTCQVNTEDGTGTGFLLGMKEKKKLFFVTNKHVITKEKNKRHQTSEVDLSVNIEDQKWLDKERKSHYLV